MIYFVRLSDDGPIKIGTTIDLGGRMRTLGYEYESAPTVLAIRDGGRDEEREHHEKFAHLRINQSEWFLGGADLLQYIRDECKPAMDEDWERQSNEPLRITFSFKCRTEYRGWISRYARFKRLPPSILIDQALTRMAEGDGFEPPPER